MRHNEEPVAQQPSVVVMGRIPPPVTGMTLVTQQVLAELCAHGTVEFMNWSVGASRRTMLTRLRYVHRYLNSTVRLLIGGRRRGKRLYLIANSGPGLFLTSLLVYVAARLGYRIYLHHHVYSYITARDRRMAWIDNWMKPHGVHVVHSEKMANEFRERYRSSCDFIVVLPSAVAIATAHPHEFPNRSLRLGMLSNLTLAKGVGRAVETFAKLRENGRQVDLALAGPLSDDHASKLVQQAQQQFGDHVTYRGPVYGNDKATFLSQLDVFLFPTKYSHESWGIVLNESLAAGVPSITVDRGCTSAVVGARAGLVVKDSEDFVQAAASQIEHWLDHPKEYEAASCAAIEQADFLNAEGRRTLQKFAEHMFSPLDSVDGLLQFP